jgi:hypothetical protein
MSQEASSNQAEPEPAPLQHSSFTISQFCFRNQISKAAYYRLKRMALGPREMRIGLNVRITGEEETRWQRDRSNPKTRRERKLRAAAEAKTHARAKRGGKLSVKSPRHISNRRREKRA